MNWFKDKAFSVKDLLENQGVQEIKDIDVVEIDELWHYTKKKRRKLWIWTAINRGTRKLITFESGSRGKKTLKRLLTKLARFNRPLA